MKSFDNLEKTLLDIMFKSMDNAEHYCQIHCQFRKMLDITVKSCDNLEKTLLDIMVKSMEHAGHYCEIL